MTTPKVAIIGAGLAGLTAAHRLLSRPSPPEVIVIDKGRRAGGRLCTRTIDLPDGRRPRFDLGPPVLYARPPGDRTRADARAAALDEELPGPALFTRRVVGRVGADGEAVGDWEVTGLTATDGMRELAFRLIARHGDRVTFCDHTVAEELERTEDGWRVHTRSLRDGLETVFGVNALILTAPVPQALELLERNKLTLPDELRYALREVRYARCVALYGLFAPATGLQPGGAWVGDGPLEWVLDNFLRNVSPVPGAVTALARPEWSADHWEKSDERLTELLMPRVRAWVGDPLDPAHVWLHRWKWARPLNPVRMPCAVLRDLGAVIAGDGFCGAFPDPVDAAVASGGVAADRIGGLLTELARRDTRYTVGRPRSLTLEVAVTSPQEALAAAANGANRLELSVGLEVGGLTPSLGAFRSARAFTREAVPIYVLIRPRAGGFAYSETDFNVMLDDAKAFLDEGAAGIVFAALTADGRIHRGHCNELVRLARGKAVFHRAFDFLPNPLAALDELIELGFERVLTSGGATTAETGTTHLAALVQHAGWQIEVLPAGRVRPENVADLVRATRCDQVHAGPRRPAEDRGLAARPLLARAMGATTELDPDVVARLRAELDGVCESLS
ncbi:copper homeostasis protein CutC [Gemmata sp. JC717]|uniref:copper homeostasis protein CutC n=1 Tax=Gemmata algarum TaxID=2975278 RepID=UPI0021BAEC0A|nr:copper homeostasis protein CutC [Gemmata algarum]MDY3553292.1 copper homeostasis protein CutC [Gemmata algarum]